MKRGHCAQRVHQTDRALQLPRPDEIVATPPQGLLRIPQQPQDPDEIGARHHAQILIILQGGRVVAQRLIEGKPGLQVGAGLEPGPGRSAAPSGHAGRAGPASSSRTAGDGVRRAGVCMALGAAHDPSAMGVRHVRFFLVFPLVLDASLLPST
jgi:hypothetical protein